MQTAIHRDTKLTDAEMERADERARSWAKRVNELMTVSGCGAWLAIQAVTAADEETQYASTDR